MVSIHATVGGLKMAWISVDTSVLRHTSSDEITISVDMCCHAGDQFNGPNIERGTWPECPIRFTLLSRVDNCLVISMSVFVQHS